MLKHLINPNPLLRRILPIRLFTQTSSFTKAFLFSACLIAAFNTQAHALFSPGGIEIQIAPEQSTLHYNIPTQLFLRRFPNVGVNYRIRGNILIPQPSLVPVAFAQVNTLHLPLQNGNKIIYVNIGGTIGALPVSVLPRRLPVIGNKTPIDITGSIDTNSLNMSIPPGNYQGTLVISATLL